MSEFVPSQRQLDISSIWQNRDCNILINAVAGSGKTTTLLHLLELCKYKTLFLAFNKSIQEEIQAKIDARGLKQGKSMTLHSLGLMAIRKNCSKIKINNGKNFDLLKILAERNRRFKRIPWNEKLKLSYTIMDMNDVSRLFLTNNFDEIKRNLLSMDKNITLHDDLSIFWQDFLEIREESYQQPVIDIDFNDMIYLPVIKNFHIPIDPVYLMIDEAQDLNLAQHKLIENLINQGDIKKWIAVGDRNQAIYGFSGAYSSSFDLFLKQGNVVELPLDICYRCNTKIIDKANEVYNIMKYHKKDKGIVATINNTIEIKENSMIICRNSKPLIDLYFELLGSGKSAYIKGEDILTGIVRFLKPYGNHTVESAKIEMLYKLEDLEEDKSDAGKIKLYYFTEDYEKFKKLVQHLAIEYETVDSLLNKIKSLFIDKKNAIMLCTIHKSKGLEADVVYILDEKLIPSKFAKSKEQLTQESNLKYVARTRAKKELYFLNI